MDETTLLLKQMGDYFDDINNHLYMIQLMAHISVDGSYVWKYRRFDAQNTIYKSTLMSMVSDGHLNMKDESNFWRTKLVFTIRNKSTDREDKLTELLK